MSFGSRVGTTPIYSYSRYSSLIMLSPAAAAESSQRLTTKLLFKVTVDRSLGPVQVVMSPENTVGDLIKVAVELYGKEKRRPLLKELDPHSFELHYSSFSLERLKSEEKLINLGSRNFFMCLKRPPL